MSKLCSNKSLFLKAFGKLDLPVGYSLSPADLDYKISFGKSKLLSSIELLWIDD